MKKAIIGAGITAGSLLVGMGGEAGAQPAPQCETVYDETLQGDSSAALREVIGEYAAAGVEVHVQVYQDATDEGVNNSDDAEGFVDQLERQCNWSSNAVNVFISHNPRAYDIDRDGKADRDISQSSVDAAEGSFINDLRDTSTSSQNDAANLLNRINPYDQEPVSQPALPRPAVVETPSEPKDVPYKEIFGGLAGLGVIGAAAARVKRGLTIRKLTSDSLSNQELVNTEAGLTSEMFTVEEQLRVLPEDDALELRDLNRNAGDELTIMTGARQALEISYGAERTRFWPSKDKVLVKRSQLLETGPEAQKSLEALTRERNQVEQFIAEIDQRVAGFNDLVDEANVKTHQTTQSDGWDLGHYMDTLATFGAARDEVANLRTQNYIEKPAEIIDAQDELVNAYVADLNALPSRRETADAAAAEQPDTIENRKVSIDDANKVLAELRQQYHETCVVGIDSSESILAELFEELKDYTEVTNQWRGVKSVNGLETAEKSSQQFDTVATKINEVSAAVHERKQMLEEIKPTIPDRVTETTEELAGARDTAFERYREDVEDQTRDQIKELEEDFKVYKDTEVSADKPKYLELAKNLDGYKSQARELTRQAVSEKEEMDGLRSNITTLEQQARNSLGSLESYISGHSSDIDSSTESRAGSIRLVNGDPTRSRHRQDLRDQVNDFRRQIEEIERIENEARADVRREEERREAERRRQQEEEDRRRRQREDDDRRRQQAASASSYSSPSSNDSGSPSSGSHDSGGY